MVKAAVRAMDAAEEIMGAPQGWTVSGGSKRGWCSWLTAGVDKRVEGVIPLVAPIGDLPTSLNLQYQSYGNWSFVLAPYERETPSMLSYINAPLTAWPSTKVPFEFWGLGAVAERLSTMQNVLMVQASGDEFFNPEFVYYTRQYVQASALLRLVPNVEHTLVGQHGSIVNSMSSWWRQQVLPSGGPAPAFSYAVSKDTNGTARLTVDVAEGSLVPIKMRLWKSALPNEKRDWRLLLCKDYKDKSCWNPLATMIETRVQPTDGEGRHFETDLPALPTGYRLYFGELWFDVPGGNAKGEPLKLTTDPFVVKCDGCADFPHPPCPEDICGGPAPDLSGFSL